MHIDADQVRHIAELARLALTDAEADASIRDLEAILTMVDRMQQIDTADVEPLAHPLDAQQPLREDRITEDDRRDALLAGAPAVSEGMFVVPRVIE